MNFFILEKYYFTFVILIIFSNNLCILYRMHNNNFSDYILFDKQYNIEDIDRIK